MSSPSYLFDLQVTALTALREEYDYEVERYVISSFFPRKHCRPRSNHNEMSYVMLQHVLVFCQKHPYFDLPHIGIVDSAIGMQGH
jgi:hypothetical protein